MSDDHKIIEANAVTITEPVDEDVLHPMVRAMMIRQDFGPDELAKLMSMQERHEDRVAEKLFNSARSRLIRDLPVVVSHNKRGNRAGYSDLPSIMRAVREALVAHGFTASWETGEDARKQTVTCVLTHRDGHERNYTRKSVADPVKGLTSAQSDQACVTYLKRQTILQALGLATDEPDADEPPPSAPGRVDINRNLRVSAQLRRKGHNVNDAEALVDRSVARWTAEDIDTIGAWARQADEAVRDTPTERQPDNSDLFTNDGRSPEGD